ncbi:MAG: hypothetical protein ACFFB3_04710 [Candidatus Hodarchaeota archaeon]
MATPRYLAGARFALIRIFLERGEIKQALSKLALLEELAEFKEIPRIQIYYLLANGLIKLEKHNLGLAEEYCSKAIALASEVVEIDMQLTAMQILLQLYLRLYQLSKDPTFNTKIKGLIKQIEELSSNAGFHTFHIATQLTKAYLLQTQFDLPGAIEQFKFAEQMARYHGFLPSEKRAREARSQINDQMVMFQRLQEHSPQLYKQAKLDDMMDYLKNIQKFLDSDS